MRVNNYVLDTGNCEQKLEVDFHFAGTDETRMMQSAIWAVKTFESPDARDSEHRGQTSSKVKIDLKIASDLPWTESQTFVFGESLKSQKNVVRWNFGFLDHLDKGRGEKYLKISVNFNQIQEKIPSALEKCILCFDICRKTSISSVRRQALICPERERESSSLDSGSQLSSSENTRSSTPNSSYERTNNSEETFEAPETPTGNETTLSLVEASPATQEEGEGGDDHNQDNHPANQTLRLSAGTNSSRSSAESQIINANPSDSSNVTTL